jgi:peptidoglycan/LPS O-acetylase OafA/YrhL
VTTNVLARVKSDVESVLKPHGRIADIELLRAIAVIFVLIEHARLNLFPWVGGEHERLYVYFGFWTGVDLFFAISGFVIARSLLPTLEAAGSNVAFFNATLAFWVRRAWRLLPSAWLWLGVIMLSVLFFNRSGAFGTFRSNFEGALAAILYVANFRIVHVFLRAPTGASFPYWSLSLEEQFYLLLPIVVFVARRWLPYLLGAAVLAQLFVQRSGVMGIGLLLNQIRSDALLLGVLIAIWSRHPTYRLFEPSGLRARRWGRVIILGGLVVLLAAAGSENLNLVTFRIGLVAILSAALVLIASYDKDYLCPDGLAKRVMLWIGSRSYALYLTHIPAYLAAREIWFRIEPPGTIFDSAYGLRFGLTAAPLLLLFADANYRFVEVPFRRRGARIAQRLAQRTS